MLGDGVAYARKVLNADWVLDMATLTGAQACYMCTGVFWDGIYTYCMYLCIYVYLCIYMWQSYHSKWVNSISCISKFSVSLHE